MIDFSVVTQDWFSDFEDPCAIDSGWCYVWAWMARLYEPEARLMTYEESDGTAHAFVRLGTLYYDRSKPCGVQDPSELWFFAEFLGTDNCELELCAEMSPEEFKAVWAGGGDRSYWEMQGLLPWPEVLPDP